MKLDAKIPSGPLEKKWSNHKFESKLVNPANKRKFEVIMVGTGLAGGSAAASLAELGYKVKAFCFQDSARRAHSIAAQGGINAAKNYQNDVRRRASFAHVLCARANGPATSARLLLRTLAASRFGQCANDSPHRDARSRRDRRCRARYHHTQLGYRKK